MARRDTSATFHWRLAMIWLVSESAISAFEGSKFGYRDSRRLATSNPIASRAG
jgi:hypothetical protein